MQGDGVKLTCRYTLKRGFFIRKKILVKFPQTGSSIGRVFLLINYITYPKSGFAEKHRRRFKVCRITKK